MDPGSFSWTTFLILTVICLAALAFALPLPTKPTRWIVAIVVIVSLVGFGILLAGADGIQVSGLPAQTSNGNLVSQILTWLGIVLGAGLAIGLVLLVIIYALSRKVLPQLRKRFEEEQDVPVWKRWVIAAYSGILEEIIFRLFLLSLIGWVVGFVWHTDLAQPTFGALWLSNALAAIVFGVVHLPRWSTLTKPTLGLVIVVLAMNGLAGLAFGYLFITAGIEAAIMAHFVGDSVLHVIGPKALSR